VAEVSARAVAGVLAEVLAEISGDLMVEEPDSPSQLVLELGLGSDSWLL
jgi:hypothetical protein